MRKEILIGLGVVLGAVGISSGACPTLDLTGDCFVNIEDFAVMAGWWLEDCNAVNSWCGGADLDESGLVDGSELAVLADEWLEDYAFVTTWNTNLGEGTTVSLALAGMLDAVIYWGDGSDPCHVTTPGPHVHTYGEEGVYKVSVVGSVTGYNSNTNGGSFSERAKLVSVDNWGRVGFTSMYGGFYYCANLVAVPNNTDGLEGVTDMGFMFYAEGSFNGDIGNWDTSNVTNMRSMFYYADTFNQDIGGWDTSNVTDMRSMFTLATAFNQDIGGWDTANVTDMGYMFRKAESFDQNIGGWNTANVTDMSQMFYEATVFDQNIGSWNTANVTDMRFMFYKAEVFNQDIGNWNTASITDMTGMFRDAITFNQDIGNWDTASVLDMRYMFYNAEAFNQDLSGWCVEDIDPEPDFFDDGATSWTEPRPNWGQTCP